MTNIPIPIPTTANTFGARDSLDVCTHGGRYEYLQPPPPSGDVRMKAPARLSLSSSTAQTAASSTCAEQAPLEERPRLTGAASAGADASERSLAILSITCEEPEADADAAANSGSRAMGPAESIMKYKTLEESLRNSYESDRRKHLAPRQKKKKAQMKRNRNSGVALAKMARSMGRRVGSLPNMRKAALDSIVRLGSTANFDGKGDSPAGSGSLESSAHTAPGEGEANAEWASPGPVAAAATGTSGTTGNDMSKHQEHPKVSTGNIFLEMLKHQEEEKEKGSQDQQAQQRAGHAPLGTVTPSLPSLCTDPNPATKESSMTGTGNVAAGAGLVFDPTTGLVVDLTTASALRPPRAGRRRASHGDLADLRKSVDLALAEEEISRPKAKKRISFKSVSKVFNDSIASLLSNGSKSQGEGIGDKEDESTNAVIKWSTLEIREYATQLDTNPSVSSGPAVALSWSYNVSPRVMIEKYEELRPPRRKMREMRVPSSEREARLLASGVSRREIEQSIKSIKEAQKKRKKAIGQMKNDTVYEKIEVAKRRLLKILGRKKSQKKEEEDLWDSAQTYFAV